MALTKDRYYPQHPVGKPIQPELLNSHLRLLTDQIADLRTAVTNIPLPAGILGTTIDGGGAVPTPGSKGFSPPCPYAGTITGWNITADVAGSAVIDVRKCPFAKLPATVSITGSAPPTLVTAVSASASSPLLTGWSLKVAQGDVFEFVLVSAAVAHRFTLSLNLQHN